MRRSLGISSSLIEVIGTPVQRATTSSMSSFGDRRRGGFIEVVLFTQDAQVFALFAFFVRIEARLLELMVRDGVFHPMHDEFNSLVHLGDFIRHRRLAQFDAGAGFIHQINGFVGQKRSGI